MAETIKILFLSANPVDTGPLQLDGVISREREVQETFADGVL